MKGGLNSGARRARDQEGQHEETPHTHSPLPTPYSLLPTPYSLLPTPQIIVTSILDSPNLIVHLFQVLRVRTKDYPSRDQSDTKVHYFVSPGMAYQSETHHP